MDPASIAAGVAVLLAPLFKKAAETFVGEAGKFVEEKTKVLWQKLREKMSGDQGAAESLERFKADPEANLEEFKATVEEKLALDPALGEELTAALAEIKRKAAELSIVQKLVDVQDVIGIRTKHLRKSSHLEQEVTRGGNVIGIDADEID